VLLNDAAARWRDWLSESEMEAKLPRYQRELLGDALADLESRRLIRGVESSIDEKASGLHLGRAVIR
jgi:hypothetical protein